MTKQIFAHTGASPKIGYAPFLQGFEDRGKISIVVRGVEGIAAQIDVTADEAAAFACALNTAAFPYLTSMRPL